MQTIVDPQPTRLFDSFDSVLTERTRNRLLDGWSGSYSLIHRSNIGERDIRVDRIRRKKDKRSIASANIDGMMDFRLDLFRSAYGQFGGDGQRAEDH